MLSRPWWSIPVIEWVKWKGKLIHSTQQKWQRWPGWRPWECQGFVFNIQLADSLKVCLHIFFKMSQHGPWLAGRAVRPLDWQWQQLLLLTCCFTHNRQIIGSGFNWSLSYNWHCWVTNRSATTEVNEAFHQIMSMFCIVVAVRHLFSLLLRWERFFRFQNLTLKFGLICLSRQTRVYCQPFRFIDIHLTYIDFCLPLLQKQGLHRNPYNAYNPYAVATCENLLIQNCNLGDK